MHLKPILNLTRLHTAGWEGLIFVLGPLLVGANLFEPSVIRLWVLGILINAFIFVLNDLADLPRDRLDPSRQASPLVSGAISTPFALWLACALPIVMWLLIAPAGWPAQAQVSFAALLLLGSYLCVYQKTAAKVYPLLLDILFGVTMAGPIPVGIAAIGVTVPLYAWVLSIGFMILCIGLNAIGGNLKDLASDLDTGFRTTAIALGARPRSESGIELSRRYRVFLLLVGSLTVLAVLSATALSLDRHGRWFDGTLVIGVASLSFGLLLSLHRLATGARAPAPRGRERFFACGMAAVLVVSVAYARPLQLVAAFVVTLVWELAFRFYWSRQSSGPSASNSNAEMKSSRKDS